MPAPFLGTYQDLVDSLIAFTRGGGADAEQRDVRTAAYLAYQHLAKVHDWQFFRRNWRVLLSEPYDTGSVVFDLTGGTYERQLVLSGGTWPSWAAYGTVLIDGILHTVATRESDTVLTLATPMNPLADKGTFFTVSSSDNNGGFLRFNTSSAHGLTSGTIYVGGHSVAASNVSHTISSVTSTTITTTTTYASSGSGGLLWASGENYTLFRTSYNMPPDFRGAFAPLDENSYMASYLQPEEFHYLDRIYPSTSSIWYWTIMPSSDSYGTWAMKFHGYPSEVESMDFLYQGRPRPIRYTGYETKCRTGSVTISSGSATVTGSATQFESGMIGSVIRVSADTLTYPTGVYDLNPWSEQKIVTAVSSTTSLTVDSNFENAYSGTKYTISDPLDIDEELNGALVALAEAKLARIRGVEGWQDYEAMADKALIYALEGERKTRYQAHADGPIWGPVYVRSRLDRGTVSNA